MNGASYARDLILVFCAGLFWSTQGLAVRLMESADAWQILFYRSVALSVFLAIVIVFKNGAGWLSTIRETGFPSILGGLSLVFAYAAGILAMQQTTIANAVLLFATAPFFAAILGWLLLSERVRKSTWLAVAIAIGGIVVMQGGAVAEGQISGNLFAVGSALGFAVFTIILRWKKQSDMMPTVFLSGVFATLICATISLSNGAGLVIPGHDVFIALLMGVFQTGTGLVLYTMGARTVPAVQLALLPLIEVVLSPVWVAIIVGEVPKGITLLGGSLVALAIIGDAVCGAKRSRGELTA